MDKAVVLCFLLLCLLSCSVAYQLTVGDKQIIVDAHNHLRSDVQPQANNMKKMIYSEELGRLAQKHAETCIRAHSRSRQTSRFRYIGENIAFAFGSTNPKFNNYIEKLWGGERKDYNYNQNHCSGSTCGHYTQIIWANTEYVGCGAAYCGGKLHFVCNYGPAGNFNRRLPYIEGTPCTKCPADMKYCDNNLCSANSEGSVLAPAPAPAPAAPSKPSQGGVTCTVISYKLKLVDYRTRSIKLDFVGSEPEQSYSCAVNGKQLSSCFSGVVLHNIVKGSNQIIITPNCALKRKKIINLTLG